jgi:hypothetical protein
MTKIDAFGPDVQYESSATRQASAENQRTAWLRQMESTQISMLEQAGARETGTGSQVSQDQTPQNPGNSNRSLTRTTPSTTSANAFALATSSTKLPDAGGKLGAAVPTASTTAAAVTRMSSAPVTTTSTQSSTSATDVSSPMLFGRLAEATSAMHGISSPLLHTGGNDGLKQIASSGGPIVTMPQSTSEGYNQANVLAQIAAAFAAPSNAADSLLELPTATVAVRSVSNMPSIQPASSFGIGAGAEESEETGDIVEQHAPKDAGETSDASGSEWQKRLLHVTQDGRDVSVSIRDQTLSPNQSSHIVYRLVADVASTGLRLRNAIVNGRQVMRFGRFGTTGVSAAQDVSTQNIDDSTHQPITQQEKQHGT